MRVMKRALATVILMAAGLGLGCGGGGGGDGKFNPGVPGSTPLGGLTPAQVDTICHAERSFQAQPSIEMDSCRVTAFLTAAFGSLDPNATDADLQAACASTYDSCLQTAADAGAGAGGTCDPPPANCTATVNEFAACINDQAAANHELAAALPACDAVTRAGLTETDGGTGAVGTVPASCQTFASKCSGGSDAAQMFATEYCALIDPCCTAAGLGSQCAGQLGGAVFDYDFDPAAAATCLDALHARQAGADFCAGLATVSQSWNNDSAVLPECVGVFKKRGGGTVAPGGTCTDDTDCAPGPTGRSACVFDVFRAGAAGGFAEICVEISPTPGDACLGTAASGSGFSGVTTPPADGVFCDRDRGLICDDATLICVAAPVLGDHCTSSIECESASTYCDFDTSSCATKRVAGQSCANYFGQCVDGTYCNRTTSQCTAQGGKGASCSSENVLPSACKAGYCGSDGTCPSPLTPICFGSP